MATSYTPNLDLNLPEVGASRDTWGTLLNSNFSTLDEFVSMAMPIGAVLDFCGPTPPAGWLVADGRTISRTTYSALFAVLGEHWGAGDGSTTFALPNLCGRASVGPGTITDANSNTLSLTFTQTLGNLSNQILQTHLPNYAMTTDVQGLHSHSGSTGNAGGHSHSTDVQGAHSHGGAVTGVGDHQHAFQTPSPNVPITWGGVSYINAGNFDNNGWNTAPAGGHTHGISVDGAHGHNITFVGDHAHAIAGDGSHQHTIYLGGSGTWFPILSPLIVVTKIIYAGPQAAMRVLAMTAPTIEGHDELTAIREELAQLRALVMPPRRLLSSPMRGSH